ncbi:NUDIX hydrolase [Streptomyces sp. NPDC021012]|uniref:NUDIX hydrolase n=1 Tax=Streptomyces sp. NPDC021012 TaxID=3365107 RepID=UPI0037A604F3
MSPSSSSIVIRRTVEAYLGRRPGERDALAGLLAALDRPVDVTARTTLPGHITCGAVVIDRQGRVLHIRHRVSGGLLPTPGGHVQPGDRTLLAAALREVSEEAGIAPGALCLAPQLLGSPDWGVHDIGADPAKDEPDHRHYDFRYVFYLAGKEPLAIMLQDEEVSGVQWLPQPEATSPTLRAKLLQAQLDGQGLYLLHLRDHKPGVIWQSGAFALLGGGRTHDDRSLEGTLLRELSEEVPGLRLEDLKPYAVEAATSIDGFNAPGSLPLTQLLFRARQWEGTPEVRSRDKCLIWRWWPQDELPDRLVPYTRTAIADIAASRAYSHMGW